MCLSAGMAMAKMPNSLLSLPEKDIGWWDISDYWFFSTWSNWTSLTELILPRTVGVSGSFHRKHDERLFWSNNSVRLGRIQKRRTTMDWTIYTGAVGTNLLWLKMVVLEVINDKLYMLRNTIGWWSPSDTSMLFLLFLYYSSRENKKKSNNRKFWKIK